MSTQTGNIADLTYSPELFSIDSRHHDLELTRSTSTRDPSLFAIACIKLKQERDPVQEGESWNFADIRFVIEPKDADEQSLTEVRDAYAKRLGERLVTDLAYFGYESTVDFVRKTLAGSEFDAGYMDSVTRSSFEEAPSMGGSGEDSMYGNNEPHSLYVLRMGVADNFDHYKELDEMPEVDIELWYDIFNIDPKLKMIYDELSRQESDESVPLIERVSARAVVELIRDSCFGDYNGRTRDITEVLGWSEFQEAVEETNTKQNLIQRTYDKACIALGAGNCSIEGDHINYLPMLS